METVTHNVSDLPGSDRTAAERLVGHPLSNDQRIVIQVESCGVAPPASDILTDTDQLPEWCNVYAGLSDDQIADLEKSISRGSI
ncbi:MAG TPA: hypothetical protein VMP01_03945 [Pirellulaceae bacterium]|nr:hypothetical protein [Pirellulaceae bacterium]